MKKRIILLILLAMSACFLSIPVSAANTQSDNTGDETSEMYDEQLKASGADKLYSSLPDETKNMLSDMGIGSFDYQSIDSLKICLIRRLK